MRRKARSSSKPNQRGRRASRRGNGPSKPRILKRAKAKSRNAGRRQSSSVSWRHYQSEPGLEKALRFLRAGNSQRLAAISAGVPVGRFRRFIRENKLAKFTGHKWRFTDKRRRQIVAITTRGLKNLVVRGFEPASWAMSHQNAFRTFQETNDISLLAPFEGVSITDQHGRKHFLETRPNVLLRLASAGGEQYEIIYRLTI
jgi:hypothetical protein